MVDDKGGLRRGNIGCSCGHFVFALCPVQNKPTGQFKQSNLRHGCEKVRQESFSIEPIVMQAEVFKLHVQNLMLQRRIGLDLKGVLPRQSERQRR